MVYLIIIKTVFISKNTFNLLYINLSSNRIINAKFVITSLVKINLLNWEWCKIMQYSWLW